MDLMDTGSFITETVAPDRRDDSVPANPVRGVPAVFEDREEAHSLGLWMRALRGFFQLRNQPFSETEHAHVATRDWSNELRVVRRALLQSSQLALQLLGHQHTRAAATVLGNTDDLTLEADLSSTDAASETVDESANDSLIALTERLANACTMSEAMLEARAVSFHAWSSFGKALVCDLERCAAAQRIMDAADHHSAAALPAQLLSLSRNSVSPAALGADMLEIFMSLARMLARLRFIERVLRRDQPLKPLLPIFTLVHEEGRALLEFIETRAMRVEGTDDAIFDALDGTSYAIGMELRKVFAHELVGLSALRQAPAIYAKVENAHGLLRDCFQQSTVALAQLFDPSLEGAQLFDAFQTKLEQSLALRRDLWTLLQLVRRAEKERDQRPVAPLLESLATFREGSLRYLMYKDWEACERFMEEVAAARGAVELAPVLHRFGAYLETLHGQVNMRAVLAAHPFEYPELQNTGRNF